MSMIEVARLSPVMSNRKLQVLAFIRAYHARHGEGPSLSEIAAACRCSRPRAQDAIRKLAAEGRIHRVPGRPRGVWPIDASDEALRQLAAAGYRVSGPAEVAPALIDLDANGDLIIITSDRAVTNASLPHPGAARHDGADTSVTEGSGGDGGTKKAGQEERD